MKTNSNFIQYNINLRVVMILRESKLRILRRILREYCTENFVYAIKFLADGRLLKFEKSWWALWIAASLAACYIAIFNLHRKWNESPVVIVYAPKLFPIYYIPFPAITICPLAKTRVEVFNLTHAFELEKSGTKLDHDSEMIFRSLAHVCPFSNNWKKFEKRQDEAIFQTLRSMSVPVGSLMHWCMWRYKLTSCSDLISLSLVDDGICYTFNALSPNLLYRTEQISPEFLNLTSYTMLTNWTQETGYPKRAGVNAYPYRPMSSGLKSGLYLVTGARKVDEEFICRGPYTGFKITVHTPDEVACTNDRFFRLNNFHALSLSVNPEVLYTSKDLRSVSPQRRKCFFNDERYLRFFVVYNQANCAAECVANVTLAKCGCVKFSMPHSAGTKICDASSIGCYQNTLKDVFDQLILAQSQNRIPLCECFPACNTVRYDVEVSNVPIDTEKFLVAATGTFLDQFKVIDPAAMCLFFKDRHFLPMWRRELFSLTDIIAKFGGMFALLMGASVMSLGEIIYYCCVRPLRRERVPALNVKHIYVLPWATRRNPFKMPSLY